jgi:hypothetical protein
VYESVVVPRSSDSDFVLVSSSVDDFDGVGESVPTDCVTVTRSDLEYVMRAVNVVVTPPVLDLEAEASGERLSDIEVDIVSETAPVNDSEGDRVRETSGDTVTSCEIESVRVISDEYDIVGPLAERETVRLYVASFDADSPVRVNVSVDDRVGVSDRVSSSVSDVVTDSVWLIVDDGDVLSEAVSVAVTSCEDDASVIDSVVVSEIGSETVSVIEAVSTVTVRSTVSSLSDKLGLDSEPDLEAVLSSVESKLKDLVDVFVRYIRGTRRAAVGSGPVIASRVATSATHITTDVMCGG